MTVTPRAYRLQGAQWTETGATEASGSGGQESWTAVLAGNGSLTSVYPEWKGNLVVTWGQTRINLATDVRFRLGPDRPVAGRGCAGCCPALKMPT